MNREPLAVIGIGNDGPAGLSAEARDHIARCRTLAGGRRHLDLFPDWHGEKIPINANLDALLDQLQERVGRHKVVVLASGDPLFFGIGRRLLEVFPKDALLFLPHLSSVQLAFARVKEAWNDAAVVSLHGRPLAILVPALAAGSTKIAIFTDAQNHPAAIAGLLREVGCAEFFDLWVCEDLGGPTERVTRWSPEELQEETFSPLNVVVLLRRARTPAATVECLPLLGIPEEAIPHRHGQSGLITKREVRLISLCHLELPADGVLWDVGAGSGSISLEAARLAPGLQVFAVERSPETCRQLTETLRSFGLANIRLVPGEAPAALADLPTPDAIFLGGSGGRLPEILAAGVEALKTGGRLVLNCVTLQSFARSWEWLSERGLRPEVTSVQIAHSRPLGNLDRLEPENPIFIVRVRKP